jgi:hypothetical protein
MGLDLNQAWIWATGGLGLCLEALGRPRATVRWTRVEVLGHIGP